jgi:hypothetical protein
VVHDGLRNREFTSVHFIVDLLLILFCNLGNNLSTVLQVDHIRKQQGGKQKQDTQQLSPPRNLPVGRESPAKLDPPVHPAGIIQHGSTLRRVDRHGADRDSSWGGMVRNIRFVMWHAMDSLPRTDGTWAALGARPGGDFRGEYPPKPALKLSFKVKGPSYPEFFCKIHVILP